MVLMFAGSCFSPQHVVSHQLPILRLSLLALSLCWVALTEGACEVQLKDLLVKIFL